MERITVTEEAMAYLSEKDPLLGEVIQKVGVLERPGRGELLPALMRQIIGQQVSMKAARTVFSRVETLLGEITPATIVAASEEEIQQCGLSFRKVAYMKATATDVLSGKVDLETLHDLPDEEVIEKLSSLKGIGRWTAEMLLMFSMGRPDVFPVDDLGIQKGIWALYQKELSKEWLEELRMRYSPYGTTASFYLWEVSAEK